ncbi:MAG: hypothetical protein IT430_05905 [Phycisphaerales bacterium]|nr:hypothetical protein [Phycisphaerales bacterium]
MATLAIVCVGRIATARQLHCPPEQLQRVISPCNVGNGFGRSVTLLESRMAAGRYDASGGRISTYLLNPVTRQWESETDIRPADLQPLDAFGNATAFHFNPKGNEWLLAGGSPYHSLVRPFAGKVYLFGLNGSNEWVQLGAVIPDALIPDGWFGNEVAWVSAGERTFLFVGAPGSDGDGIIGSTYVFERDEIGVWIQRSHLQAPDGEPEDAFGYAISSAESNGKTVLAIGAPGHINLPNTQPGSVYFYGFDSGANEWTLEAHFEAPDPYVQDEFGVSVSVEMAIQPPGFTHRVAVGRRNEGAFGASLGPGAVYLYLRDANGSWRQEAHLVPPVSNPNDMLLGHDVSLDPDGTLRLLAAAAENRDFGTSSGCVYVYERDDMSGEWLATQALYGREQDALDVFGFRIASGGGASDDMAVIGAHTTQCEGGLQTDAVGAVYSFDLNPGEPGNCPPPVLTLQKVPDCFSGPGGEIEVRWFQATPDQRARIAILYAKRTGNFVIPNGNPCSGTALELGQLGLQVAHTGSAGQFGAGRIKRTVPRSVCGGYLQLVDIARCATSNVVRIE